MAKKYTSKLQSLKSAQQYIAEFDSATPEIQYVFIGKTDAYGDSDTPFDIVESPDLNDRVFTDMIAAKRVKASDVNLVIPRVNWESNKIYRQYDPQQTTQDSITGNTSQNLEPMYVFTEGRNVYKCLSNNSGTLTANTPTGDFTTSNGVITNPATGGGDGYIWKYMYSVRAENKFLNSSFLPVPTRNNESTETDTVFNLNNQGVVEGELTTIVVADGGTQYRNFSNIRVEPFLTGDTVLTVDSTFLTENLVSSITVDDLANANMSITGTGIQTDTHILSTDSINNKITLNKAASSNGGGSNVANNISTTTRVFVDGDGAGALANATVDNGVVTKITVDTIGKNYEKCNALVFGTGTGVDSRVILAPKFGHGFNLAKDLIANSVMVTSKIGEIDSTENGKIPVDIKFRQIGLIRNPYKYDTRTAITDATANDVVSQVTTLQLSTGTDYIQGEKVFQGSSSTVNFAQAVVHRITTSTEIEVTGVEGEFRNGVVLNGATSGADRFVVAVANPEFEQDSAEVLYVENLSPITRIDGQAEDIRLILQF